MDINKTISKFDNHLTIKKIKEYFLDASKSNFKMTGFSR